MSRGVFELASRYVEPSIKRAIALKLFEKKIPPIEISRRLEISPSLTSRYVKGERGLFFDPTSIPELNLELDALAEKITLGLVRGYELRLEIARIVLKALSSKKLCRLHKAVDNSVDPLGCDVCPSLFKTAS
ncbi:MAG: hypothetical protein QXW58_03540 [Thermosphaera sp.]